MSEQDEGAEALEVEFDLVAGWTADAIRHVGPASAVPGACRGSGRPSGLAWLARRLDVVPGTRLLDIGAGVGGPGAWAAAHTGAVPVLVEPMPRAMAAARATFGLPAVVAPGEALPFPSGSFRAAWMLGVLSTSDDRSALLAEARRVLAPDGRLGLLCFLRTVAVVEGAPEGDRFADRAELGALLEGAGLVVVDEAAEADLPEPDERWSRRAQAVSDRIDEEHAGDPRLALAHDQERRMGALLGDGTLVARLLVCRPAPPG